MLFGYFGLFALCVVGLFFASKIVYTQVLGLAKALRIPPFAISLFLVAFSTSIPELFVGITSAANGVPAFSLGDILGSNIVNLTCIAGLVILLSGKRVQLERSIDRQQLAVTFLFALAPIALIMDGELSKYDGVILLALYVLFIFYIRSRMRTTRVDAHTEHASLLTTLSAFMGGIALLLAASEGIIIVASHLSTNLNLAPFIVGVFAIAFSTSLPELIFGIRSAMQKAPELSLADVVGSSAVNATLILGGVSLIHPIAPMALPSVLLTGIFSAVVFVAFFILVGTRRAYRLQGAGLIILYLIFVAFTL